MVACFDPDRVDGSTQTKFFSYIDICLRNRFRDLLGKQKIDAIRDAARNEDNMTISVEDTNGCSVEEGNGGNCEGTQERVYKQSSLMRLKVLTAFRQQETMVFMDEFKSFVEEHDPDMVPLLEALKTSTTFADAVRTGVSPMPRIDTNIDRIKTLMRCFTDRSIPVPKRRAPYQTNRRSANQH